MEMLCGRVYILIPFIILIVTVIVTGKEGGHIIVIYLVLWAGPSWEFHSVFR